MVTFNTIGYHGRMGNQLFQFAVCFGVSKKLGYNLILPKQNVFNKITQQARDKNFDAYCQLLECFDINPDYFGDVNYNNLYNEKHFHYDENIFQIRDNTNLHGYFQSEKYFHHCLPELLKELKIKEENIFEAKKLLPVTEKELVSIHVRRGDNVIPTVPLYHPCVGLEFITPALETNFNDKKYHFCIVSDDPTWCREIWKDRDNFTIIQGANQYVDFAALSLCDHHIISNSTFSWWSSYLSKNENKKIIAPKNWFGDGYAHHSLKDLYTQNMIIL